MYSSSKSGRSKKLTFTQINDNQFLLECLAGNTRISGEHEYAITYIDLESGPLIHIGKDFLGRGIVSSIEIIETDILDSLIVKITL